MFSTAGVVKYGRVAFGLVQQVQRSVVVWSDERWSEVKQAR